MKTTILLPTEVELTHVKVEIAVRYDEEDIPNDFPLRVGDMWIATIEIDTGKIIDWPIGKSGDLYMKVCDQGTYRLLDNTGEEITAIEGDYVPNNLIPGQYGDYVDLKINDQGIVTNWHKKPSVVDFFPED
jgi:hypothetical protein